MVREGGFGNDYTSRYLANVNHHHNSRTCVQHLGPSASGQVYIRNGSSRPSSRRSKERSIDFEDNGRKNVRRMALTIQGHRQCFARCESNGGRGLARLKRKDFLDQANSRTVWRATLMQRRDDYANIPPLNYGDDEVADNPEKAQLLMETFFPLTTRDHRATERNFIRAHYGNGNY